MSDFKIFENMKVKNCVFKNDVIFIQDVNTLKEYSLVPEGACCSTSWIEHCEELPSDDEIISKLECVDIGPNYNFKTDKYGRTIDEKGSTHECLAHYFYRITTNKGSYDIEMRNSSNGYYGGWLEVREVVK